MKIGICGNGECGKDTAAEFLRDEFGLRYVQGTSMWAASLVMDHMAEAGYGYETVRECWEDRRNHRMLWATVIGEYNATDPVRMYRDCLANQDILTGVRWRHEFQACRAAGLCDVWLYIDRPGTADDTNEITPADCDAVIRNHGTLDEFKADLSRWACRFLRSAASPLGFAQRSQVTLVE